MLSQDTKAQRSFKGDALDLRHPDWPPECLLALAILRTRSAGEVQAATAPLELQSFDWQLFTEFIDRHFLAPTVHGRLRTGQWSLVPDQVQSHIRVRHRTNALRVLLLTGEFLRLSEVFEAHRIPVLPLKGFTVSVQAYGDLFVRHGGDIDLLVAPEHADHAGQILNRQGYVGVDSYEDQTPFRREKIKQFRNHFVHWNEAKGVRVETHWRFHPSRHLFPVPFEDLLDRSVPVSVGDRLIRAMSPEDTLLFLLLHGAGHAWSHLFWLCDVAGIVEQHQSLDWLRLAALSRELHISRPFFQGLILANCLLGTPIPQAVLDAPNHDPALRSLVETSLQAIREPKGAVAPLVARIRDVSRQLKLSNSLAYKLDHIGSRLLDVDGWNSALLPDALFPLYYLLGPVTWLMRQVRRRG